jgi:hypothetical protein
MGRTLGQSSHPRPDRRKEMSDDLIKRLRDPSTSSEASTARHEAADRIEELEESNKELTLQLLATSGQAADALDKLDKAVEMLQSLVDLAQHGRFVLRELEGGE